MFLAVDGGKPPIDVDRLARIHQQGRGTLRNSSLPQLDARIVCGVSPKERTEEGRTKGEHIIKTLIQKAMDGDMKAVEYVLDRMGGKPLQSVELSGSVVQHTLTDVEKAAMDKIIEKLRANDPIDKGTLLPHPVRALPQ